MRSQNFKQLVLESWKYDGFEKAKEDKKEEQPSDLKGKDIDTTPYRNLGAYVASSHLTPIPHIALLGANNNDTVNCGLGSLYNSWALDFGIDIYICNDRNRSNYTMTRVASALDVIDSGKQTYLIESFGIVTINIDTTTGLAYF
jgi:hypothetical protein